MPQMRNQFKLLNRVLELSEADEWNEAIKEWEVIRVTEAQGEDFGECTCGHYPIKEIIQMFNSKNSNEIIVGNCCVKKFYKIKDYDKVFKAVKKNKINRFMIDFAYKKGVMSDWNYGFLCDVWRKKKLSYKQAKIFDRLKEVVLSEFKGNKGS